MPYEEIFWILFIFEFFYFLFYFLFLDFFIFQKSHVIPYPTIYLECLPNSIHSFFVSISWKIWKCPNFSINWNYFLICWKCQFFVITLHNLLMSRNWINQMNSLMPAWHFQQIENRFQIIGKSELIENKNEWIELGIQKKLVLKTRNIQQIPSVSWKV